MVLMTRNMKRKAPLNIALPIYVGLVFVFTSCSVLEPVIWSRFNWQDVPIVRAEREFWFSVTENKKIVKRYSKIQYEQRRLIRQYFNVSLTNQLKRDTVFLIYHLPKFDYGWPDGSLMFAGDKKIPPSYFFNFTFSNEDGRVKKVKKTNFNTYTHCFYEYIFSNMNKNEEWSLDDLVVTRVIDCNKKELKVDSFGVRDTTFFSCTYGPYYYYPYYLHPDFEKEESEVTVIRK